MNGWMLITLRHRITGGMQQHVIPQNDLREHQETPNCFCKPTEHADTAGLWVHHSLDGREQYETGELKPQ